jgi:hypothetical protein
MNLSSIFIRALAGSASVQRASETVSTPLQSIYNGNGTQITLDVSRNISRENFNISEDKSPMHREGNLRMKRDEESNPVSYEDESEEIVPIKKPTKPTCHRVLGNEVITVSVGDNELKRATAVWTSNVKEEATGSYIVPKTGSVTEALRAYPARHSTFL